MTNGYGDSDIDVNSMQSKFDNGMLSTPIFLLIWTDIVVIDIRLGYLTCMRRRRRCEWTGHRGGCMLPHASMAGQPTTT
jgi:hypothetical protein